MLSVSPTGRLTSDIRGEYTDNDRHFRARGKDNFALTFIALPMAQILRDDESLLSDGTSDSVRAWLRPATSTEGETREVSSESNSDSDSKRKDSTPKKSKKTQRNKKFQRVDADELADLQQGMLRVECLTHTPDVEMNVLFDPVRADAERRALNLHGRVDKITVIAALAGRLASQAESTTGRPSRVHGRIARGRIAEVVAGSVAMDRMKGIHKEFESSLHDKARSKKNRDRKKRLRREKQAHHERDGSGGLNRDDADDSEGSGVSLGSQDSDESEDKAADDEESGHSSFIASSDDMSDKGSESVVLSESSEGSDSDSGSESSISGSVSSSSSSSSSDHKRKKHSKDKKKDHKNKNAEKREKRKTKHGKKKAEHEKKKAEHEKKKAEHEKKKAEHAQKKVEHKKTKVEHEIKKTEYKKAEPVAAVKLVASAAGLKKPLNMGIFATKTTSDVAVSSNPVSVVPKVAIYKASTPFDVNKFMTKAVSMVESSASDDDNDDEDDGESNVGISKALVPIAAISSIVSTPATAPSTSTTNYKTLVSVNTKVGFGETYFSSVAVLAVNKVAPLFVPPLEATYDLCGKYSKGLLKKIKFYEERAVATGMAPTESDYVTMEAQTARHLAFILISLEPNAQNRLVHKAYDIACATDSGIKGPVISMHMYPSNTMHRHFVDTLVSTLCRTSLPIARAYSAIYAGMRVSKTPLAQLACDLMHARNVTFLSKDKPLPEGLSRTYVCAISGTPIAPGEHINLYRLTKRGSYEGEGWSDPRPWQTDHMRQHSYVFATRSVIKDTKIALPFGEPMETPRVVGSFPPGMVDDADNDGAHVIAAAPASTTAVEVALAPIVTDRVSASKRPREEVGEEAHERIHEKPEKRARITPEVVTMIETTAAPSLEDITADTDSDTRYVTLFPVLTSPYTGSKALRAGLVYTFIDRYRHFVFHKNTTVMIQIKKGTPTCEPYVDVPADYLVAILAMRLAQTPAQLGAAMLKASPLSEFVWTMMCLARELIVDASQVPADIPAEITNIDPFGGMFGTFSEPVETRPAVKMTLDTPPGTTINLAMWGLLAYMCETMFKNTALVSTDAFKRVHADIRSICNAIIAKKPTHLLDKYRSALFLLIEAGMPLATNPK